MMTNKRWKNASRKPWLLALLLCLGMGIPASLPASDQVESAWFGRFAVSSGSSLVVENVQGTISAEGWDGAQVEVVATKKTRGSADSLDDVRIAVERGARSLTFRTLYPEGLDEPVRVDYRFRVPRPVRHFQLRTLQGNIAVRDLKGVVDARTLLGDIHQEDVAGRVIAQALTGNIVVSLCALPAATAPLSLETINGNVDLLLPPHADADLELSAVAGRIEGAYLFEASSVPGDAKHRARVGRGGVRVSVRTVRGNIRVGEQDGRL
jgi:DUF4097 and DUF4098 domain-containing protein YvlB